MLKDQKDLNYATLDIYMCFFSTPRSAREAVYYPDGIWRPRGRADRNHSHSERSNKGQPEQPGVLCIRHGAF